MMPDEEKTLAIAKRTKKNLDFVYESKIKGADVDEFTHLLNSMLCMVVCLREEYFKERCVTWDDLIAKGLSTIDIVAVNANADSPKLKLHNNFSQLITHVRNGFSHNCFSLNGDTDGNIVGVTIWNIPPNKTNTCENRSWQATISEEQLKELAHLFISYICKELQG